MIKAAVNRICPQNSASPPPAHRIVGLHALEATTYKSYKFTQKTSVTQSHSHTHTSAQSWVSWQPDTDRVPHPVIPLRRSSNYSYVLDSMHVGSRACPMRYHWDVIALLSQGRQPLKMPVQPPQTLLEWLTSIHKPVPDNVLSCRYLQTQQARFN